MDSENLVLAFSKENRKVFKIVQEIIGDEFRYFISNMKHGMAKIEDYNIVKGISYEILKKYSRKGKAFIDCRKGDAIIEGLEIPMEGLKKLRYDKSLKSVTIYDLDGENVVYVYSMAVVREGM